MLLLPRHVPLPQHDKVKAVLQRMELMGVFLPFDEATEWYTGMVLVSKPKDKIRICSDMTHLNELFG